MERNTEPTDENQVPYYQSVICHVTEPPSVLYFSSNTQDDDHLHRLISTLLMPAIEYRNAANTYVNNVLNMCSNPWTVWTESYTTRDFQNMCQ
jgi:thiaminase